MNSDKQPKPFLLNRHEWLSLVLLALALGIAVRSVEQAKWLDPQPALWVVLGLGLAVSVLISRLPVPPLGLFLGLLAGAVVTIWQVSNLLPQMASAGSLDWILRFQALLQALAQAQPSQNNLYFGVFLAFFTWSIGFLSGWFILKKKNPWFGAIFGASALLINLTFLTDTYYTYFVYYLIAAMVLVCQVSLSSKIGPVKRANLKSWKNGVLRYSILTVFLSVAIIAGAWFSPQVKAEGLRSTLYDVMPWGKKASDSSTNFFNALNAVQAIVWSSERNELTIGGPVDNREDVLFEVESSSPYSYWRTRIYETYRSTGWSNQSPREQSLTGVLTTETPLKSQIPLSYTVTDKVRTDIILTAGAFLSSDVPVNIHLPSGTGGTESANVLWVKAPRLLNYNDSYTVKAVLTNASPAELSQAGDKYTQHVRDIYLQLPAGLPNRVKQQAVSVVSKERTPYGKVAAVLDYLKGFEYVREGTAAPSDRDAVEDFLFHQKKGNCTNFASAAVVLLRSAGVPARLAAGYLSSSSFPDSKVLVKAKDGHAWPEVYFPGYGWIQFEATPFSNTGSTEPGNVATSPSSPDVNATPTPTAPAEMPQQNNLNLPTPNPTIAGALIFIMAVLLLVVRRRRRKERWNKVDSIYARMCFFASLFRLGPAPNLTPLEYGAMLASVFPSRAEAINHITWVYARNRFDDKWVLSPEEIAQLRNHWRSLLRALLMSPLKRRVNAG